MKNVKVVLAVLPFLFSACTDEYAGSNPESTGLSESARMGELGPENPSNPFDAAGAICDEITELVVETKPGAGSVAAIAARVDAAMESHPEWGLSAASSPLSGRIAAIALLLDNSDPLGDAMAGSGMGAGAKSGLSGFVSLLSTSEVAPYEDIHALAVIYESDMMSNTSYTGSERRRLLEIASIARYSLYRKKRKDKDWETSVSVAGAISGSSDGASLAIRMAVVIGICKRQGITQ
ncbi:hypothetical protein ACFPVY_02400 [Flavobacterium qiangtangense]|uniref:Lipoprotein n=1 Tax=Flavobacterium qiangtangense TaxID=1442595 RepID=A0ABW1PL22_9FLAO